MTEENKIQEFRLKSVDKTKKYFIERKKQNGLISKKHKKGCKILKYIEHSLMLSWTDTGCVSISAFASLVSIPAGIASSALGIKICAIFAVIKKHKSTIKKKKKKHNKVTLLAKTK